MVPELNRRLYHTEEAHSSPGCFGEGQSLVKLEGNPVLDSESHPWSLAFGHTDAIRWPVTFINFLNIIFY